MRSVSLVLRIFLTFAVLMLPVELAAEDYPIWWSPKLELESLEEADARLRQKMWPDEPLELVRHGDAGREAQVADSCAGLLHLTEAGYEAPGQYSLRLVNRRLAWCRAIALLKGSQPARTSYLRDFVFDQAALEVLPAFVVPSVTCSGVCLRVEANRRRLAASALADWPEVIEASETHLRFEEFSDRTSLEILARGDFNGDGLDDLLVMANSSGFPPLAGRWASAELYIISRDGPDEVLFVVDAGRHLCSHYTCEPPYDLPPRPGAQAAVDRSPACSVPEAGARDPQGAEGGRPNDDLAAAEPLSVGGDIWPEDAALPVWWDSAYLRFERFDELDERLDRPFDLSDPLELFADGKRATAKDCRALNRLLDAGYGEDGGFGSISLYATECRTLAAFERAVPAERSYLRDFVLDADAQCYLPAMIFVAPSCEKTCRQRRADQEGIPLGAFETDLEVVTPEGYTGAELTLYVNSFEASTTLNIRGRGDFNGDGLDDLLLDSHSMLRRGQRGPSGAFVLTRTAPGAVLRVVEPERHGCPDFDCPR